LSADQSVRSKVLSAVEALLPEIAACADEIEKLRGLPPRLSEQLQAAGAYRMFIPRAFGGEELTPVEVVEVIEAIATADASAAWTVMVALGFNAVFSRFPAKLTQELFAAGPDVLARGALAPQGVAVAAPGGFVVKGQWPLASGSYPHRWIIANALILEDGKPRMGPGGVPDMRLFLLPAEQAQFLDTWDSVGLRGSSSHDFVLKDVFVPEERTGSLFAPSSFDTPVHHLPFPMITGPSHAAVCLGVAKATLDDLANLAKTKRPAFSGGKLLAEDPVFCQRLGELSGRLAEQRAYTMYETAGSWTLANSGAPGGPLQITRMQTMVSRVHFTCVDIVNEAFTLAGSSAIYNRSPISRRWRDIRTAAQHAAASTSPYQALGKLLMGE
jgi:alkylation response protein AidB-like acyl-CoA dehydrogenase